MAIKPFDEIAFRVVRFSKGNAKGVLDYGARRRSWGDLKFIPTKRPDVEIGYDPKSLKRYGELDFYVFFNQKCVASVSFHYAGGQYTEIPKELLKLFRGKKAAVPHVVVAENFRGLGYPSMLYAMALKKGAVLMSDHHSSDAAGLWEGIARKYKAKIAYASEASGWQLSDTPLGGDSEWKIMYL
jgi:hypothetical protein